jgi:hypothetical protein
MENEDDTTIYKIKVEGKVHKRWADWFSGMQIQYINDQTPNPVTILRGPIPDQAALRGILVKLWDLNLTLVSVQRLDDDQ